MSETILIEIGLKAHALEMPQPDEIELLASILPELWILMQSYNGEED